MFEKVCEAYDQLLLQHRFFALAKDPNKTEYIFDMVRLSLKNQERNAPSIDSVVNHILADPSIETMWRQRWIPPRFEVAGLQAMPEGSLGRAFHDFIVKNNLDLNLFPEDISDSPIGYLSYRMYHAHDIWHVLLGYDTSVVGELEVQAFSLAQTHSPLSTTLITAGLLNTLRTHPESAIDAFDRIAAAYERGKKMKPLLGMSLETRLAEPIEVLRAECAAA